jgi:hypothetical protein
MLVNVTRTWRCALWIAGVLWVYSWLVVYLEIHRWHHMTRSFRLNPPPAPPGMPPPHPGMFLLSARALSLVAPASFLLLLLIVAITRRRTRSGPRLRIRVAGELARRWPRERGEQARRLHGGSEIA